MNAIVAKQCLWQRWPTHGSRAAWGSFPGFRRLLHNYQTSHKIKCIPLNGYEKNSMNVAARMVKENQINCIFLKVRRIV